MKPVAFRVSRWAHPSHWLLPLLLVVLLLPSQVLAHSGHGPANTQTFTQTVGPYELAVTVESPFVVPSTVYLTSVPQFDFGEALITYRAAPRGQSFPAEPVAQVKTIPNVKMLYYSEFEVDRDGDWDLEVTVEGPLGKGTARVPFTIEVQPFSGTSIALIVSLSLLVLLMIISIITGLIFQRAQRPMPKWLNWTLSQSVVVCVVLAIVFGIQQFNAQVQEARAIANPSLTSYGRPHVNAVLTTVPALPEAGKPFTLTMDLSDGSTGLPVEDIITHHDALMHLIVVGGGGADFQHVHPARVAPGRYEMVLVPQYSGTYTAYIEIERQASGTQLVLRTFEVGGSVAAPEVNPGGLGQRQINGLDITLTSSQENLVAGKQTTLSFEFSQNGQPVIDLQGWLGMAGHLIAMSDDASTIAHVHAAEAMMPSDPVLASGTVFGPKISFVYTFPQSGHYLLWAQFRHNDEIITLPFELTVE